MRTSKVWHCRILEFVKIVRTIRERRSAIDNSLDEEISNARSEATNTHIRLLVCRAYGYQTADFSPCYGRPHPRGTQHHPSRQGRMRMQDRRSTTHYSVARAGELFARTEKGVMLTTHSRSPARIRVDFSRR